MAKRTKAKQAEYDEAVTRLREWVKPGDTVYTVLDHVSQSGMSRIIRVVLLGCEGGKVTERHPNYAVGTVLGLSHGKRRGREVDGLRLSGCGMDMGFHLVYSLSRALYGAEGAFTCIGDGCPSNDHSNGDRDYTPHAHSDGGYALRQRWL